MTKTDPGILAVELLMAAREDTEAMGSLRQQLADLEQSALAALDRDDQRLAFWLDVYNATVLRHAHVDISYRRTRSRHFARPLVTVAGRGLSLDAIEHGILRRSRWKLGLGYVANPRPSGFERMHRVDTIDPRIHFALNCGATSCPPIAAYRAEDLDDQLELATRSYLGTEVIHDGDVLRLPAIMLAYIGDFRGPGGIRRLLREHGIDEAGRSLRFRRWDWTPAAGRWLT